MPPWRRHSLLSMIASLLLRVQFAVTVYEDKVKQYGAPWWTRWGMAPRSILPAPGAMRKMTLSFNVIRVSNLQLQSYNCGKCYLNWFWTEIYCKTKVGVFSWTRCRKFNEVWTSGFWDTRLDRHRVSTRPINSDVILDICADGAVFMGSADRSPRTGLINTGVQNDTCVDHLSTWPWPQVVRTEPHIHTDIHTYRHADRKTLHPYWGLK